jgi:leader peptidase (prepilin peptidase)/N-methyltransferase
MMVSVVLLNPPFYAFGKGLAMGSGMAGWPVWQGGWSDWGLWGLVVAGCALLGAGLRRWADAYGEHLEAGAMPDARTLWGAALRVRMRPSCVWRDGGSAALAGGCAALLLLTRGWAGLGVVGLCLTLLALAWIDARTHLLPDALTLPAMVAGWAWGPLGPVAASSASALIWAGLAGAAAVYRALRGHDGFGAGDIKYLAALAAWIGPLPALGVLWAACVLGLLAWALAPAPWSRPRPLGPCLTLVAVPGLLAGPAVQSWF